jgi:hypothetical protein
MGSVEDVRHGIDSAKDEATKGIQQLMAAKETLQNAANTLTAAVEGSNQQEVTDAQAVFQKVADDIEGLVGEIQNGIRAAESYAGRL